MKQPASVVHQHWSGCLDEHKVVEVVVDQLFQPLTIVIDDKHIDNVERQSE